MSASKNPRYGPVPSRACRDLRLGARHLKLLIAIASFDRFGKNGQGCWVSQNKIAEIVRCSKSHLSDALCDLRDWGYLTSKLNPDKRWFRVHRVIYTDEDSSCLEMGKSVHSQVNKSVPSQRNSSDKSVPESDEISSRIRENQFGGPKKRAAKSVACETWTIVPNRKRTIEEADTNLVKGQNCAEARSRSLPLSDAEKYLTECERLAASPDRDSLQYERQALEGIAEDACLPEEVNERAAKLLARIPGNA